MRHTIGLLVGFPVVWLLAALLHVIDPDVNGVAGLASPSVLLSTLFLAGLFYLPAVALLAVLQFLGRWLFAAGLVAGSAGLGLLIALLGSSATTPAGWLVSFAGATGICLLIYGLATLPGALAIAAGRPHRAG